MPHRLPHHTYSDRNLGDLTETGERGADSLIGGFARRAGIAVSDAARIVDGHPEQVRNPLRVAKFERAVANHSYDGERGVDALRLQLAQYTAG